MASTGLPDFSRTPQIQQGAVIKNLVGVVTPGVPTITTSFPIDDKTTLIGFVATIGWYSPTGPYTWNMVFRFAGNVSGSFDLNVGITIPAAGAAVEQDVPFNIAVPARLASLLGTNANVSLTWSCLSTLPDGSAQISANMILGVA